MALPAEPLKAIFPIVAEKPGPIFYFLGTGFFIRDDGLFLTAKHIFEGIEGGECKGVMLDLVANQGTPYQVSDLRFCEQFDIAAGYIRDFPGIQPLGLARENAPMNRDVVTTEYSGTRPKLLESGKKALVFTPYFRKGNVICRYESNFPELVPTQCLNLSFPALKGASGAPVVVELTGFVVGMVVRNVEAELLPAQIERIVTEDGYTEERKYFLPVARAISWRHLADFVSGLV